MELMISVKMKKLMKMIKRNVEIYLVKILFFTVCPHSSKSRKIGQREDILSLPIIQKLRIYSRRSKPS